VGGAHLHPIIIAQRVAQQRGDRTVSQPCLVFTLPNTASILYPERIRVQLYSSSHYPTREFPDVTEYVLWLVESNLLESTMSSTDKSGIEKPEQSALPPHAQEACACKQKEAGLEIIIQGRVATRGH
jgi:hypothetical protein